jgi:hypothetical protein
MLKSVYWSEVMIIESFASPLGSCDVLPVHNSAEGGMPPQLRGLVGYTLDTSSVHCKGVLNQESSVDNISRLHIAKHELF